MMRRVLGLACFLLVLLPAIWADHPIVWDTMEITHDAQPDEREVTVTFNFRNASDQPVEIHNIVTSCHCTVVRPHPNPWVIPPGASEKLEAVVDVRSRRGGLSKRIYVGSSAGEQKLVVHVNVPVPPAAKREMNLQLAQLDRQVVLTGDCASCHVTPALGKTGQDLFAAACLICHTDDTHRATFVPDLHVARVRRDAEYWRKWISDGAPGTLMPGFAKEHGGFLERDEIDALVAHLLATLPTEPVSP